jgi:DNA-binding NtrC family response regulator
MAENHKLLVVDDEPDILLIIVRALQKYYFEIDDFNDPVKALAHFENHSGEYSLVLSDMRMPGMSGMEFLNFVKRIRPDIPIMAMTAYSTSDGDISRAVPWIKREEIMHKPFKALDICNAVKRTLNIAS